MSEPMGVKETMCTRCAHRTVCKNTETFLAAQKEVDKVTITRESTVWDLSDIPWIRPVELVCKNYMENRTNTKNPVFRDSQ